MQLGGALHRILWHARHAHPRYGPPKGCKTDLKDGFYMMGLSPSECLGLAVILPKYKGEPQLVRIPLACTKGWVESPPTFCTMSETVCDNANARMQRL